MKTALPNQISTLEQAKSYLKNLYENGDSYHPEDSAADCFENIDAETAKRMDDLMDQVYSFASEEFDPCMFILELDPEYKGLEE